MACGCIKIVNEQIAQKNGQLTIGFHITDDHKLLSRLIIATEKKDKACRTKVPIVSATYCPFCGVKFDGCVYDEPKPQAAAQEGA